MKTTRQHLHLISVFAWVLVVGISPGSTLAQVPSKLEHTFFSPSSAPQLDAQQGASCAVDGNFAVIGAPLDDTGGTNSGVVKVYDTSTGQLLHTLHNPVPGYEDNFGYSVAVAGTRVVVGTPFDSTRRTSAGIVYIYDLTSASPTQPVIVLNNPHPTDYGCFGISVATAGSRLVVGAYLADGGIGRAYVYDLAGANPTLPIVILANPRPARSPGNSDEFG